MGSFFKCSLILVFVAATSAINDCPSLLKKAGASEKFSERVVHAVHAITVNDLKKFDPSITEKNKVPTVNRDKDSTIRVLSYAPDIKSDDEDKFNTTTMKLLDLILSHIDDRKYYESDYTLIEQIVHTAHMQDHRMQVRVDYEKLKKTPPSNENELCPCVLDIENNGVLAILDNAARYAHDRKSSNVDQGSLRYSRLDSHTKYSCDSLGLLSRRKRGIVGTFLACKPSAEPQQLENKPFNADDCSTPVKGEALNLVGSGAWSLYKKRLQCLEKQTYDAALFLYCALKQ